MLIREHGVEWLLKDIIMRRLTVDFVFQFVFQKCVNNSQRQ